MPRPGDAVKAMSIDADTGRETFTYTLESGKAGVVHVERVLDHNEEPTYFHGSNVGAISCRITTTASK